jgi:hypothetical protein
MDEHVSMVVDTQAPTDSGQMGNLEPVLEFIVVENKLINSESDPMKETVAVFIVVSRSSKKESEPEPGGSEKRVQRDTPVRASAVSMQIGADQRLQLIAIQGTILSKLCLD